MKPEVFRFRLYVAGAAPNSMQAISNLTALCETHLADRYEIEIVDVVQNPAAALTEAVYMTPTVVCVSPNPGRRIVGTLSNPEPVLQILGLGSNLRRSPGMKGSSRRGALRRPA